MAIGMLLQNYRSGSRTERSRKGEEEVQKEQEKNKRGEKGEEISLPR
jgi:hypothetical protein